MGAHLMVLFMECLVIFMPKQYRKKSSVDWALRGGSAECPAG